MTTTPDVAGDPHAGLDPARLRHPDSVKWALHPEGVIPMWIADMDYPVAPVILNALRARLDRSVGYPGDPRELRAALKDKLAAQGLTDLPDDGLAFTPSVVPGIYSAINALTTPGEAVVTMTPIYHPFHLATTEQGRRSVGVPLKEGEDGYEINWFGLDNAARNARLLLLCHPHNPTGRDWTPDELDRLRDIVVKRDLFVVSDELHADLRYADTPFEAFAADPKVRARTVTLTGPAKAFNTAGLGIGAMISHDPRLIARLKTGLMGHESALSRTAWQAALEGGTPWLQDTVAYLRGNRDFMTAYLREHLPWVKFYPVQATYLQWLDLRAHPRAHDIQTFLLDEAKVAVHPGPLFAPDAQKSLYEGFVRVNFATSRPLLEEALTRMRDTLNRDLP